MPRRPSEDADPRAAARERRARALLGLAALAGLVLAAAGLMRGREDGPLPAGAVAAVNGTLLHAEQYRRAVEALAADRRDPIGDTERRHVLERLIDEELLVQRGLALGLARGDPRVRGDLVAAVIAGVLAESESAEPGAAEVEAFYRGSQEYFARAPRLWVRELWVRAQPVRSDPAARERAARAVERLRAGEDFATVSAELGDPHPASPPAGLLPAAKLREYVGPTATRSALALEPGGVSEPLRGDSGVRVLQLVDRRAGRAPPLAQIEEEVRAELRRRAGDRALRDYLDALRERADVRLAPTLP